MRIYNFEIILRDECLSQEAAGAKRMIGINSFVNSKTQICNTTKAELIQDDVGFNYFKGFEVIHNESRWRYNIDASQLGFELSEIGDIKDKSIYRFPKLDLPTMKVNNLKDKYNVKVTRKPDKADLLIVSQRFIESMADYSYYTFLTKDLFKKYLKEIADHMTQELKSALSEFITSIKDIDARFRVAFQYRYNCDNITEIQNLRSTVQKSYRDLEQNIKHGNENMYIYSNVDQLNTLRNITDDQKIILDTDLVKICNEDSVVLTEEQYKSLEAMFKSADPENVMMGLEIMSNCNVEKSIDKLACLFFFYEDWLRYGKNWNSVNVKALRKRLSGFSCRWDRSRIFGYDHLCKELHKENALTSFAYRKIAEAVFNYVIGQNAGFKNSKTLTVDFESIKLKEGYQISEGPLDDLPF